MSKKAIYVFLCLTLVAALSSAMFRLTASRADAAEVNTIEITVTPDITEICEDAETVVAYTYNLTNLSSSYYFTGSISDDVFGPVGSFVNLAPGGWVGFTVSHTLNQTTTNVATGSGTFDDPATTLAEDTDEATVTADACYVDYSLQKGYWKTHSKYGPSTYDNTWALISDGEDTPFFLSGQSYYEVLWAKGGNAYYTLAKTYIATELNMLNGTSIPPEVLDVFNQATALFEIYTPENVAAMKGKSEIRQLFIEISELLDM